MTLGWQRFCCLTPATVPSPRRCLLTCLAPHLQRLWAPAPPLPHRFHGTTAARLGGGARGRIAPVALPELPAHPHALFSQGEQQTDETGARADLHTAACTLPSAYLCQPTTTASAFCAPAFRASLTFCHYHLWWRCCGAGIVGGRTPYLTPPLY